MDTTKQVQKNVLQSPFFVSDMIKTQVGVQAAVQDIFFNKVTVYIQQWE